jgi:hypothetical protein
MRKAAESALSLGVRTVAPAPTAEGPPSPLDHAVGERDAAALQMVTRAIAARDRKSVV